MSHGLSESSNSGHCPPFSTNIAGESFVVVRHREFLCKSISCLCLRAFLFTFWLNRNRDKRGKGGKTNNKLHDITLHRTLTLQVHRSKCARIGSAGHRNIRYEDGVREVQRHREAAMANDVGTEACFLMPLLLTEHCSRPLLSG